MTSSYDADEITAQLRSEEAKLRRRSTWLTLIPVAVAAALIVVTTSQVSTAQAELDSVTASRDTVEAELQQYTEEVFRRHAEIDSLKTLAEAYYKELEGLDQVRATTTRNQAIGQILAVRSQQMVYLHVDSRRQMPGAERFGAVLGDNGFAVNVEVVEKGPERSQLRYFRPDDRAGAEEILRIAKDQRIALELRDLSKAYSGSESIPPGTYEIWWATSQR